MAHETTFHLVDRQFVEHPQLLLQQGELQATIWRFPSGVCALRLANSLGHLDLLPFQGQQIWDAWFRGRRLTMKSMFDQPYPTRDFLATFGAFWVHCGATGAGVPGPDDTHPLHGELPNAPYQKAWLTTGTDSHGDFIGLGGEYRHTVAFNYNYIARPVVKLHAGSSLLRVSFEVENLKRTPMPLMYLAHINYLPVDHGRLVDTCLPTPQHMHVRAEIPSYMAVSDSYRQFIEQLKTQPQRHLVFKPELAFDPEVVFFMDYLAGTDGLARSMQIHPDGSADVVRHRPTELKRYGRWICRTADQQAIGFEPATAEPTGFTSEKKKGNVQMLAGGEIFRCEIETGVLTAQQAKQEEQIIAGVVRA